MVPLAILCTTTLLLAAAGESPAGPVTKPAAAEESLAAERIGLDTLPDGVLGPNEESSVRDRLRLLPESDRETAEQAFAKHRLAEQAFAQLEREMDRKDLHSRREEELKQSRVDERRANELQPAYEAYRERLRETGGDAAVATFAAWDDAVADIERERLWASWLEEPSLRPLQVQFAAMMVGTALTRTEPGDRNRDLLMQVMADRNLGQADLVPDDGPLAKIDAQTLAVCTEWLDRRRADAKTARPRLADSLKPPPSEVVQERVTARVRANMVHALFSLPLAAVDDGKRLLEAENRVVRSRRRLDAVWPDWSVAVSAPDAGQPLARSLPGASRSNGPRRWFFALNAVLIVAAMGWLLVRSRRVRAARLE